MNRKEALISGTLTLLVIALIAGFVLYRQNLELTGWTVQKVVYSFPYLNMTLSCNVNITYAVSSLQVTGQLGGMSFSSDRKTFTPTVMNAGDTFNPTLRLNIDIANAVNTILWVYFENGRYMAIPFTIAQADQT
jgi:hypothetical protein